jgi:hypothetical protein
MPLTPPTTQPRDLADWSDCAAIQQRMTQAVEEMQSIASEVGTARTVLEFSSDRRKRALARACAAALSGGESAAKAELEARASESYGKELAQLQKEHQVAEQTILEWDACKLGWETCRSLLAMQRESVRV